MKKEKVSAVIISFSFSKRSLLMIFKLHFALLEFKCQLAS